MTNPNPGDEQQLAEQCADQFHRMLDLGMTPGAGGGMNAVEQHIQYLSERESKFLLLLAVSHIVTNLRAKVAASTN